MEVPERLALIGGSILLASTLIFTLKSQASNILPKVEHPIDSIYSHVGDAQYDSEFGNGYQQAQQNHWPTGNWGTAKFYVDDHNNLYVGSGNPRPQPHAAQSQLKNAVGSNLALRIQSITFEGHIQVPNNSWGLLSDFPSATKMNGLDNIDTSPAANLSFAFSDDASLSNLDISSWQTPHLQYAGVMFGGINAMKDLNLSSLDTSHADTSNIFAGNKSHLGHIQLGNNTYLGNPINGQGTWSNGQRTISDTDLGTAHTNHTGDWHKINNQ